MNELNPPGIVKPVQSRSEMLARGKVMGMAFAQAEKMNLARAVEFGKLLEEIRVTGDHGEWIKECKTMGINVNRANELRRISKLPARVISTCESIRDASRAADSIPDDPETDSTPFVDQASDVQNPQPSGLIPPRMPASSSISAPSSSAPPATQTPLSPQAAQQEIMCVGCQRKRRVGQPMPKNCPECKRAREEEPPWEQPAGNGAGSGTPAGPSTPPASAPTVGGGGSSGGTHEQHMVKCPTCRGNGQVSEAKAKRAAFVPPTLEEVTAYCLERKNKVDPIAWMAHYGSNGWKVGKVGMTDWKLAVITWETNAGKFDNSKDSPGLYDGIKEFMRRHANED